LRQQSIGIEEQEEDNCLLLPGFKKDYAVMFVTMPFYVIFKKIATIYERFVMARKLVEEKL
jgi:hypothetical protein